MRKLLWTSNILILLMASTVEISEDASKQTSLGAFSKSCTYSYLVLDGRYMFFWQLGNLYITDFHLNQTSKFRFDLSSVADVWFDYDNVVVLDANTVVVAFNRYFDMNKRFIAIGRIDRDQLTVTVEQPTVSDFDAYDLRKLLSSYPTDLKSGLHFLSIYGLKYSKVVMGTDGRLETTRIDFATNMKLFGFFDGYFYGLDQIDQMEADRTRKINSVNLIKYSAETDEQTQMATKNWEILLEDGYDFHVCYQIHCIGRTLFVHNSSREQKKTRIFSMDLNSLEWKRTNVEVDGMFRLMMSDGKETLFVGAHEGRHFPTFDVHRFDVKESVKMCNESCSQVDA
ncbi:hypothetical protein M3Y94_00642700 [Aphelenchoides besseyi]|nr:hypothetical protein M3Y94_00642700 [Aphelenchoides besseyi]